MICGDKPESVSADYLEQIAIADRAIGILLRRLETANLLDRYFILVQSDHGGHDKTHGTDMPEDLTIPWIAAGAKVGQRGEIQGPVRIFDTAPTLARVLDLQLSADWEGKPITQIF